MSHAVSFVAATFGPHAEFEGRIVAEVERYERSGMLRVLDVLFVRRVGETEIETRPGVEGRPTLVSQADIDEVSAVLEPGQAALLLLVEQVWLADLERAIGDTGGRVVQRGELAPEQVDALGR